MMMVGSEKPWSAMLLLLVIMASSQLFTAACPSYSSIFSFGDSMSDTGNFYFSPQHPPHYCLSPPYGQTYFHHPFARCSDGRLIIDFIAESLGIPLVKPYLGIKYGGLKDRSVKEGVNFGVIGAPALDIICPHNLTTNCSLSDQFNWFKEMLPHLCNSSQSCRKALQNSLFLVGEIGGNDFNHPLHARKNVTELKTLVPQVLNAITSTINGLVDLGAHTLMVPGIFPMGCIATHLTKHETTDKSQYDSAGCLKWLNEFAEFYNQKLQHELDRLRGIHPHAIIIYADYYNAALPLYHYPKRFGFRESLKICCGTGRPYNYNASKTCGTSGVTVCDDPSQYIGWDGVHFTDAANRFITDGLINGPYTFPQFSTLCFINQNYGHDGYTM